MAEQIFRIPDTLLRIRSDGMWMPADLPNQMVADLPRDRSDSLAVAYAGTILELIPGGGPVQRIRPPTLWRGS
jgi:hypothetical protein